MTLSLDPASLLVASADAPALWETFLQYALIGLTNGALFALIALGYTMVYGIIELINFAHGDVFMLGSFLALTLVAFLTRGDRLDWADPKQLGLGIALLFAIVPPFCAAVNVTIDRVVYKPLRNAPKLAPLVSAIGVSFILMNVGLLWGGPADRDFPNLISRHNLLGEGAAVSFTLKDLMVIAITIPIMVALTCS